MSGLLQINVTEARGQVATTADIDELAVVMGVASGTAGMSSFFLSGTAAKANRGYGDAVDTLCQIIEQKQSSGSVNKKPAAMYSLAAVTNGSCGTVDSSGKTGTSAVTMDAAVHPYGTYEAYIRVVVGCTVGTTGGKIVWSLDNGRTESGPVSLGTATSYTITEGNVKFALGTGTLVTGDIVRVSTIAPAPDTSAITAAFAALAASSTQFGILVLDFDMVDAAMVGIVSSGKSTLISMGKRVTILGRTRLPDRETSETEAAWSADAASDFLTAADSSVGLVALYGLQTDAMTGRQYFRSALAQVAADFVRVPRSTWPDSPSDQPMANFSLVDSTGATVGHDEGPRGSVTGLSNDALGNRFICGQRLPDASRMEDVFLCVPWTLYAADERIRNVQTRRVVNAIERETVAAGTTGMGSKLRYFPAVGATPARLTTASRRAIQSVIYTHLASVFKDDIQNTDDASLETGLVQVNPNITVSGGNLAAVSVTVSPLVFGYLLTLNVTLAIQQ